ncbi:N-formylglutamate deformylase [Actinokineospora spheciospongiae]|uniref:N-formylglutamate deformylase n=1 Tax=Actinokineospora spheciospongiae TaxID=909613 RepID=W7IRR8_9PSEU|nr:alpha/beta fold hydrolase [Actinokineospora spheciospongiae]EWC63610.1 N-formylglutamate deformylase [Actinokineospora spheciospongiae]PWW65321.1 pimeloyl-ACP methyl ester carboxylesterase [Actinokineospora spheciospongiae]
MNVSTTERAHLTRVPLSAAALPPVDRAHPAWPGEEITSAGITLHVRRTPGEGPVTAVYVHGLGGAATNWTDLAGQLAGYAPGIAVDLPGFGRSAPPAGYPFTIQAHADALAAWLRGLDLGPVHLLANSMGGTICVYLAARHPDLVRTLTLVSPAVPDLRPDPRRMSDPRMALAMLPLVGNIARRRLARTTPRQRATQMLNLCFADPSQVSQERLEETANEYAERAELAWANPALAQSTVGLIRSWLAPGTRSVWRMLPKITAPTLVVWGTEDKLVTVRKAPRTARLVPGARLLVLPRTGHVAQMERPATVARAVLGLWEGAADGTW